MRESDIVYESGALWVGREAPGTWTVYRAGAMHSVAESSYARSDLAVFRADYLVARDQGLDSARATAAALKMLRRRLEAPR